MSLTSNWYMKPCRDRQKMKEAWFRIVKESIRLNVVDGKSKLDTAKFSVDPDPAAIAAFEPEIKRAQFRDYRCKNPKERKAVNEAKQIESNYWNEVLVRVERNPRTIERFSLCGCTWFVQYSRSRSKYRIVQNGCNHRLCPWCSRNRARRLAGRIGRSLTDIQIKHCRFATLTLKHGNESLNESLNKLRDSFRRLRQQKFWKSKVTFGYAVIEVTFNKKTSCWHAHLHVLMHGDYIPSKTLSRQWLKATGDSFIVKINKVNSRKKVMNYITKYLSKGIDYKQVSHSIELGCEYYGAVRNRKLLIRFGKHPKLKKVSHLSDEKISEILEDWRTVATLSDVLNRARIGEPWALKVTSELKIKIEDQNKGQSP